MSSIPDLPDMTLPSDAQSRLDALLEQVKVDSKRFIGYPCNMAFDYKELYPFLGYTINNVGDPYADSNFQLNTHEFEREVISQLAGWLKMPDDEVWGYVTNGGTEGNMYGLFVARERYPAGVIYYSEHTHYSVAKIVRILGCRAIMIRGRADGQMDYEDLREMIKLHRDVPPIIMANLGTTMHQAVDDIGRIREILDEMAISRFHIHGDAALSGMILPFLEDAPPHTFADGLDTFSVSGHKFIGSPVPCGIALARKPLVNRVAQSVEYVGCLDTTITGSRNAYSALMMWTALSKLGEKGLKQMIARCMAMADQVIDRFKSHGIEAWRYSHAITVVFPNPGAEAARRWMLATRGDMAHILCMAHMDPATLDTAVDELAEAIRRRADDAMTEAQA